MKVRAVCFDYGGTLDGPGSHWLPRFHQLYRDAGLALPFDRFRAAFDHATRCGYAERAGVDYGPAGVDRVPRGAPAGASRRAQRGAGGARHRHVRDGCARRTRREPRRAGPSAASRAARRHLQLLRQRRPHSRRGRHRSVAHRCRGFESGGREQTRSRDLRAGDSRARMCARRRRCTSATRSRRTSWRRARLGCAARGSSVRWSSPAPHRSWSTSGCIGWPRSKRSSNEGRHHCRGARRALARRRLRTTEATGAGRRSAVDRLRAHRRHGRRRDRGRVHRERAIAGYRGALPQRVARSAVRVRATYDPELDGEPLHAEQPAWRRAIRVADRRRRFRACRAA